MKLRKTLGALIGAGALAVGLAGTSLAQTGNQTNVAWDFAASDCTGGPGGTTIDPGDGNVAWVFVHADVDHTSTGTLTANFQNAGQKTAQSYDQGGVKYLIITPAPDTLLNFSDTIDGGKLNLSHTCYGGETTTTSTTEFTSSESSESTSTSTTSFTSSESSESTVIPSQPNTATIGTAGSSTMSNGLWMLLAGIGLVGGSMLVLMPERAKGKR